jgi:hypothetical protein
MIVILVGGFVNDIKVATKKPWTDPTRVELTQLGEENDLLLLILRSVEHG